MASARSRRAAPTNSGRGCCPAWSTGPRWPRLGLGGHGPLSGGLADGDAGVVLGGDAADPVAAADDDVVVVERGRPRRHVRHPENLDPTRRSAASRLTVSASARRRVRGAAGALARLARWGPPKPSASWPPAPTPPWSTPRCASSSAGPSPPSRRSSTTAPTCWSPPSRPSPRSGTPPGRHRRGGPVRLAAASAAHWRCPAARNAEMNIQVHGGIGFTWEHDAHLHLRRALVNAVLGSPDDAEDVTAQRPGDDPGDHAGPAARGRGIRTRIRADAERIAALQGPSSARRWSRRAMMPHWPQPWGLAADAVEQMVIDEEFVRRASRCPDRHHRLDDHDGEPDGTP